MASWQLRVQRYDRKNGNSRISGTQHINGDDFAAAVNVANNIVHGMKSADPKRDYRITSLMSHDYRGDDCEGGIYPFETAEEMTARIADKTE